MLRSKATAALMKLKEIDRKYKIKSSEDLKLESTLSDISGIDSGDEISKHLASSGDKPDAIITNTRTRLDIRMPEAHMERTVAQDNESELVTISDKSKKQSPKSHEIIYPEIIDRGIVTEKQDLDYAIEEENVSETLNITSLKNPSVTISEEREVSDTETSISEDVPEALSSARSVSNHSEADMSREITLKSVESVIDADARVQSDLDEDPSTLLAYGTYSDDFVKTSTSENAREPNNSLGKDVMKAETEVLEPESTSLEVKHVTGTPPGYYQRTQLPELDKNTKPDGQNIELLHGDANSDAGLTDQAREVDNNVSEEAENLPLQRSSQSSSVRSSKEHRRSRRPHTSSSSRGSKSQELPSSFRQKDLETTRTSGTLSSPKSRVQSSQNSPKTNRSGSDKNVVNFQTVFLMEAQKDEREVIVNRVSWGSKDEEVAVTSTRKVSSRPNESKHTKVKDLSTKESPPLNDSKKSKAKENTSAIELVPSTMVGPVPKYPKFSKDDESGHRPAQYSSKCQSVPRGQKKQRSNKRRTEDVPGSRHRAKGGSLRQWKKQSKEEPGFGYEARDVDRLRQQVKELRLQQERDQLRVRVYVQQMMNEQLRLSARDCEFRESIDQLYYGATGSGQAKSLRSFFKPLDLPNVAAFKRPDFEEDQAASVDLDNKRQYLHLRMIRERILGIRHWLKQQFVLYRDYSSLVSSINAKYIPVTLKDTKKMIHDMQKFYNDSEKRHCQK